MKRIIILFTLFIPAALLAKKSGLPIGQVESNQTRRFTTSVEIQNLFSTHATNFYGIGLTENYRLTHSFSIGLGTEYSWCGSHYDNGWSLTDLRFLAVYLDSKMNLTRGRKLTPFLHLSTGVTFENYKKQEQDPYYLPPYGPITPGSEQGLYVYSGGGASLKIGKHLYSYVDIGFKGYHMSLNALDVNPHGFNLKLGLDF